MDTKKMMVVVVMAMLMMKGNEEDRKQYLKCFGGVVKVLCFVEKLKICWCCFFCCCY